MKRSQILIVTFSLSFGLGCFVMWMLFMIMADDLNKKIAEYESQIIELEWENSQVEVYCSTTGEKEER
jgi:hypothetical protein